MFHRTKQNLFLDPRLEVGAMKRQLISCTNANVVRKLLVKLMGTNPAKPLWTINPRYVCVSGFQGLCRKKLFKFAFLDSWTAPIPLDSVIKSMQRCFLQDFAYVLVGKAREFAAKSVSTLKRPTHKAKIIFFYFTLIVGFQNGSFDACCIEK